MLAGIPGLRWLLATSCIAAMVGVLAVQTSRLRAAQKSEAASAQVAAQWRTNFEAMEATNAGNVQALEKLQAEHKRIADLAVAARRQSKQLADAYEEIRKDLYHASGEDRLSPDLCRTFNELRRLQGQPGPACHD